MRKLTMAQVVGENVRELRRGLGWSQERMAAEVESSGVSWSQPTVAQMEAGKRPTTVDELLALAVALAVPPEHLIRRPPDAEYAIGGSLDHPDAETDLREAQRLLEHVRVQLTGSTRSTTGHTSRVTGTKGPARQPGED